MRARYLYEQAWESGWKEKSLLLKLGRVNMAIGDVAQAYPYIEELISLYPDYPLGWMLFGDFYKKVGDATRAEAAYDSAVKLQH